VNLDIDYSTLVLFFDGHRIKDSSMYTCEIYWNSRTQAWGSSDRLTLMAYFVVLHVHYEREREREPSLQSRVWYWYPITANEPLFYMS